MKKSADQSEGNAWWMGKREQVGGLEGVGASLVKELLVFKGVDAKCGRHRQGEMLCFWKDADLGLAVAMAQESVDVECGGFFV